MPNLVQCPQCAGMVLVPGVDDQALQVSCPLCAAGFVIADLSDSGMEVAVAATTPASVCSGKATVADQGDWRYPGFAASGESTAPICGNDDVVSGCVTIACESTWTYPGLQIAAEESAVETPSGWPYEPTAASAVPVVRKVTRIEEVRIWCYPGLDDWPAALIEVEVEIRDDAVPASESSAWTEATDEVGYTIAAEPQRVVSTTAPVRSPSAARTSKRKKSKEINPVVMLGGVVGGGVVGLFLGYCILYLIMVKIMGRPGDFSNFWQ